MKRIATLLLLLLFAELFFVSGFAGCDWTKTATYISVTSCNPAWGGGYCSDRYVKNTADFSGRTDMLGFRCDYDDLSEECYTANTATNAICVVPEFTDLPFGGSAGILAVIGAVAAALFFSKRKQK